MTSLVDKAARGAGITLGAQVVRFVLQFGSMVVLARLLTPDDFGLVAMVAAVIALASVLRDFGLSSAAIQTKSLTIGERDNLFWLNTGLGTFAAALVIALTPAIARMYDQPKLVPVVPALAAIFVLSGINTQYAVDLTRKFRFFAMSMADIGAQVVGIGLAIGIALAGGQYWALIVQQVSVALVTLIINVCNSRWLPGRPRRDVSVRRFLKFGSGLLATQGISHLTKNIDNILIGVRWGEGPLGLYSRAYQLLMMPINQINAPLSRVVLPLLSRVQDDRALFARYVGQVQLVGCYVTATVFTVAAVLSDPLVRVIFGDDWIAMAPIFAVLALGGVFRALSQVSYWIYLAKGRTGAQLRLFLWTRPAMILIIAAGVPWGALGVAVGHSVAYAGFWAAAMWAVGRATGVDTAPLVRRAVCIVGCVSVPVAAGAGVGLLVPVVAFGQLAIGAVGAAALFAVVAWVFPWVRADVAVLVKFGRKAVGAR